MAMNRALLKKVRKDFSKVLASVDEERKDVLVAIVEASCVARAEGGTPKPEHAAEVIEALALAGIDRKELDAIHKSFADRKPDLERAACQLKELLLPHESRGLALVVLSAIAQNDDGTLDDYPGSIIFNTIAEQLEMV